MHIELFASRESEHREICFVVDNDYTTTGAPLLLNINVESQFVRLIRATLVILNASSS